MGMVELRLVGRTPHVQGNGQMADPDNEFVKQIKIITDKNEMTEDDQREKERLQWFGSLYTDPVIRGPVAPTANMKEMLIRTAATSRKGKTIERAVTFVDVSVPLAYEGPREFDRLWELEKHRWRTMVKIQRNRVPRMRPIWPEWSLVARCYLMTDLLDFPVFKRIVELAGDIEGYSEARSIGMGRFAAEVIAL